MLMDEYLEELKDKWDFTTEQLDHIKNLMVNYACATNMDSTIVTRYKVKDSYLKSEYNNRR